VELETLKGMFVVELLAATSGLMVIRRLPGRARLAGNPMWMAQGGMLLAVEEWRPMEQIRSFNAAVQPVFEMPMEMRVALQLVARELLMGTTLTDGQELLGMWPALVEMFTPRVLTLLGITES
jgi:hypothetical protein